MECRPGNAGCKPFDVDAQGNPLGILCAGKGCGGWICANPKHSEKIVLSKSVKRYCRVCIKNDLIPATFRKKNGLENKKGKVEKRKE